MRALMFHKIFFTAYKKPYYPPTSISYRRAGSAHVPAAKSPLGWTPGSADPYTDGLVFTDVGGTFTALTLALLFIAARIHAKIRFRKETES